MPKDFEEFVPGKTASWKRYLQRLEFFFEANDVIDDRKKRAQMLSKCGDEVFTVICSIVAPLEPKEVPYTELVNKISAHYDPKPSVIMQRFNFHTRRQRQDESIMDYVAELRRLATNCEFGTGPSLDICLCTQLVCGIEDEALQQQLLTKPDLKFDQAIQDALAAEAARRHLREMRGLSGSLAATNVNLVSQRHKGSKFSLKKDVVRNRECFRCGDTNHIADTCRFRDTKCRFCQIVGHIERACMSKNRTRKSGTAKSSTSGDHSTHVVQAESVASEEREEIFNMFSISSNMMPPFMAHIEVNGAQLAMEVDGGAAVSIIGENTYRELWPNSPPKLVPDDRALRMWNSDRIKVLGTITVQVTYGKAKVRLPLVVANGGTASLLGRNWFKALGIGMIGVHQVVNDELRAILQEHDNVFSEELGAHVGPPVSIEVDPSIAPKFVKCRPLPFTLRPKVELDRLVQQGVLEPSRHSRWATPIVPVVKRNGQIRLCGDYRCTVNAAVHTETYPLPTPSEIHATLAGGRVFTKLDMAQAYQQLKVDDKTAELLTINTSKGLFQVKRLAFGVSSAVAVFQRFIDTLLAGIEGVKPYLDDILVVGDSLEEHNIRLREVLQRLSKANLRLKKDKCVMAASEIEYLGVRVDALGLRPTIEKTEAIHGAPEPKNKTELRAFLGMLNFYNNFLKDRATKLEPLYRLLDNEAHWQWLPRHKKTYEDAKKMLRSDDVLTHYDVNKPLVLACDASPYGIGAVLSHTNGVNCETPIAYYSRTLSSAERNYAQIDREALSIIAAVKRFHQYLGGRQFTIMTDHQPLLGLLGQGKGMPLMISPRMMRWSLMLSAYDYQLRYRPGSQHGNADGLSRVPRPVPDREPSEPPMDVLLLESIPNPPLNAARIAEATRKDPVLSRVLHWVLSGWPMHSPGEAFDPFFCRRVELTTHKDCVLWGSRVVVPNEVRKDTLKILHNGHPGMVRMKALGRSYVWWPNMDREIEAAVKQCPSCQGVRHAPPRAPVHPWERTTRPWSRIHLDFAGPFQGRTFLIVVDSYSKWLEVLPVPSMSSLVTIAHLRLLFATHGLPDTIVTDNGTSFTSNEFREFCSKNLVRLVAVAPYHPSSNGQAERMVQTTKEGLRKIQGADWPARLARLLMSQHTTPHVGTGRTPAELLMNRRLTTMLSRLHPDLDQDLRNKQEDDILRSPGKTVTREFQPTDLIHARNFTVGPKWVPATIVEATGPVSYRVQTQDGQVWKRHVDQVRERSPATDFTDAETAGDMVAPGSTKPVGAMEQAPHSMDAGAVIKDSPELTSKAVDPPAHLGVSLRRSQRSSRCPIRYDC